MLSAKSLLARLSALDDTTQALLDRALSDENPRLALAAVKEIRELVEAFARVSPIQRSETHRWELERQRQQPMALGPDWQSPAHPHHPQHQQWLLQQPQQQQQPPPNPLDTGAASDADFDTLFDMLPDVLKRKRDSHEGEDNDTNGDDD